MQDVRLKIGNLEVGEAQELPQHHVGGKGLGRMPGQLHRRETIARDEIEMLDSLQDHLEVGPVVAHRDQVEVTDAPGSGRPPQSTVGGCHEQDFVG